MAIGRAAIFLLAVLQVAGVQASASQVPNGHVLRARARRPAARRALPPQVIAKRASVSTVLTLSSVRGGKRISLGTGFAVSPGPLVIGDTAYAMGNPEGMEGTFSQGMVSSFRRKGAASLIQITAPISPGSSGGPVFNIHGEVIGVSVSTLGEGQNINFAVPAARVIALLNASGVRRPAARR